LVQPPGSLRRRRRRGGDAQDLEQDGGHELAEIDRR
jgi:hypothetical protein